MSLLLPACHKGFEPVARLRDREDPAAPLLLVEAGARTGDEAYPSSTSEASAAARYRAMVEPPDEPRNRQYCVVTAGYGR